MVPIDPLRLAERIHGHLAWLAAIALLHPAILLRNPRRRAHLSVGLAVGGISTVFAIGCLIYGSYRDRLRQSLFQQAPPIGYLFERKEHLAWGTLLLAWAGGLAYVAATRVDAPARDALRRASHWAFVIACVMALVTASMGIVISAFKTF